ncbi:MAG TPA: HAD family hydrolase [Acidimicrobiales bacterium]|nr:HAD family hydrolase [Acidimicrobiales bacterium]
MAALVLFDLDNTLLDRVGVFRRWAMAWASERGLGTSEAVQWLEAADGDGFALRPAFFAQVKERFNLADPVDDLVEAYSLSYPTFVEPAPQPVKTALTALKDHGYRVGIVTNGPPSQEEKISRMQLGNLVDGWAVSALVGANKPSPAIFDAAATACGVTGSTWREGSWMVGDSAEADIGGAQASRLRSIWIDRGRNWPGDLAGPDRIASGIPEAVDIILADG